MLGFCVYVNVAPPSARLFVLFSNFSYLCLNNEMSKNVNTHSYQTRMWLKFKVTFASVDASRQLTRRMKNRRILFI